MCGEPSPGTGRLVCGTSDQGQIRPERVADDSPSSPGGGGGGPWRFPQVPTARGGFFLQPPPAPLRVKLWEVETF